MTTYYILKPPPEAYKYRKSISAMSFKNPDELEKRSKKVGGFSFRVEYPPEGGILVYNEGMKYPSRGIPYPEALVAVDGVKGMIKIWVRSFNPFTWRATLSILIRNGHKLLSDHMLEERFLSPFSKNVKKATYELCTSLRESDSENLSELLAWVIEYDDAYKNILMDLFYLTNSRALLSHPIKELKKIARAAQERLVNDHDYLEKYRMVILLMLFMFLIPKFRRAVRHTILQVPVESFYPDDGEAYYMLTKKYYNFFGRSHEERMKIWSGIK